MGLALHVDIETTGIFRQSGRLRAAVRTAPEAEIYPDGVEHVAKARASFDRGDNTYPLSDGAKARIAQILATAMKEVVLDRVNNLAAAVKQAGEVARDDVQQGIRSGRVTGPARSPAWEAKKGNSINMLGLGDEGGHFVDSLQVRLVNRR